MSSVAPSSPVPAPRTLAEAVASAPLDDEPYTDEERAAVEEARREGPGISTEELCRLLGL
jgi:hypothetical protein